MGDGYVGSLVPNRPVAAIAYDRDIIVKPKVASRSDNRTDAGYVDSLLGAGELRVETENEPLQRSLYEYAIQFPQQQQQQQQQQQHLNELRGMVVPVTGFDDKRGLVGEEHDAEPIEPKTARMPRVKVTRRISSTSSLAAASGSSLESAQLGLGVEDWNSQFQRILALPETDFQERRAKYSRLSTLARDFESVAALTARLIVEEMGLDEHRKTIHALDASVVGGVAGGEKFLHHGILYKVARDWAGLYGSDEAAGKAASHELAGAALVWASNIKGLCVPLSCLLRYRGIRVLATAVLPIHPTSTLVYGSRDAGKTARNTSKSLRAQMRILGKRLNLREHQAGALKSASLVGPVDIEGHIGFDGRHYLLDLARLLPPTPPRAHPAQHMVASVPSGTIGSLSTSQHVYAMKNEYLYRLFRSELVILAKFPLSSDTWAPFANVLPENERQLDEKNSRDLFNFMRSSQVPVVAKLLDEQCAAGRMSGKELSAVVKNSGINCRHLGLVLRQLESDAARRTVMTEIVARAAKSRLNTVWRSFFRNASKEMLPKAAATGNDNSDESDASPQALSSAVYVESAADFFTSLLLAPTKLEVGIARGWFGSEHSLRRKRFRQFCTYWGSSTIDCDSVEFPIRTLVTDLQNNFDIETIIGFNVRERVDIARVIARICELETIQLDTEVFEEIQEIFPTGVAASDEVSAQVLAADLTIHIGIKSMPLVALGDAVSFASMAPNSSLASVSQRLFSRSCTKFEEVLAGCGTNYLAHRQYADVLANRALLDTVSVPDKLSLLWRARTSYLAMQAAQDLVNLAEFLVGFDRLVLAIESADLDDRIEAHEFAIKCVIDARGLTASAFHVSIGGSNGLDATSSIMLTAHARLASDYVLRANPDSTKAKDNFSKATSEGRTFVTSNPTIMQRQDARKTLEHAFRILDEKLDLPENIRLDYDALIAQLNVKETRV